MWGFPPALSTVAWCGTMATFARGGRRRRSKAQPASLPSRKGDESLREGEIVRYVARSTHASMYPAMCHSTHQSRVGTVLEEVTVAVDGSGESFTPSHQQLPFQVEAPHPPGPI